MLHLDIKHIEVCLESTKIVGEQNCWLLIIFEKIVLKLKLYVQDDVTNY